jgi:hypothetical protein
MKTYKVRIKKSPESMAYGGQSNYGLDLGQKNIYSDMTDNPYESVSNTLQPVDREEANIEAELGETAYGDFNNDGRKEHMKIGGERHTNGGTPLNVPEGTFIYSDTKKLRIGGPVLGQFGKSPNTKQKYTPAQLAKQYDINKYQAILDDPYTDKMAKSTAARMIDNYEKKLGGLALVQESMKGFPQGIPDVAMSVLPEGMGQQLAEMGGFYGGDEGYYQGGGTTPKKVKKEEIAKYEKDGYKRVGNTNVWRKTTSGKDSKDIIITPGKPGTISGGTPGTLTPGYNIPTGGSSRGGSGPCANLKYTVADMNARPNCYSTFLNKQGFKDASDGEKQKGLDELLRGKMPKYTPGTKPTTTPATPETKTCPDGPNGEKNYYVPDPNNPNQCIRAWEDVKEITPEEDPTTTTTTGGGGGNGGGGGRRPYFGKQFMVPPKRYTPYAAPLNAMIPEPTFYDPNRELAEGASQRNMMAAYMSQMDPQQFSARASALNAQGAEQAANTIGRYQNMNVGVANQFSPLQTDIMNKVMAYRADAADKLAFNAQQEDKAYRNTMRNYLKAQDMYDINEYDINTKRMMLNETNPYYSIEDGPRGSTLNWKDKTNWMNMVTGQSAQPSTEDYSKMELEAKRLKDEGHDAATINNFLRLKFPNAYAGQTGRGANNAAAIQAQYMNMNRVPSAQSAYPFGYDDGYGY